MLACLRVVTASVLLVAVVGKVGASLYRAEVVPAPCRNLLNGLDKWPWALLRNVLCVVASCMVAASRLVGVFHLTSCRNWLLCLPQ